MVTYNIQSGTSSVSFTFNHGIEIIDANGVTSVALEHGCETYLVDINPGPQPCLNGAAAHRMDVEEMVWRFQEDPSDLDNTSELLSLLISKGIPVL